MPTPAAASRHSPRRRPAAPLALALAGSVALAALSLLAPSAPSYDPWAWILWGRDLAHGDFALGGPSWKPLPLPFTAAGSLAGSAAPAVWLVVARAGALAAIALAFRLARRLVAGPAWARTAAGATAAAALAAIPNWVRYFEGGNAEPLVVAFGLAAVDRALDHRRGPALVLAALAALGRPELYPPLALVALVLARRDPRIRPVAAAVALLVPALWIGGDWAGSGSPLSGSQLARRTPHSDLASVLTRAHVALPVLAGALVAIALGIARAQRAVVALAALAAVDTAIVVAMYRLGYGGQPRFLVPAAALLAVLFGVAVGELLALARGRAAELALAAMAVVAVALVVRPSASAAPREIQFARTRAEVQAGLRRAIAAAGGRLRVLVCGHPAVNDKLGTALAWELHIHASQVGVARLPAVIFSTRAPRTGKPPPLPRSAPARLLAETDGWRVTAVASGPRCARRERRTGANGGEAAHAVRPRLG